MAYRTVLSAARGDPGIFSGIGRALKGVARIGAGLLPGPLGAVARAGVGLLGRSRGGPTVPSASFLPTFALPGRPGGRPPKPPRTTGAGPRPPGGGRRMNPANAKAGRRAIRRIKSLRKMLQSIERELPRRPCAHGSRGVITRSEASRALRR